MLLKLATLFSHLGLHLCTNRLLSALHVLLRRIVIVFARVGVRDAQVLSRCIPFPRQITAHLLSDQMTVEVDQQQRTR